MGPDSFINIVLDTEEVNAHSIPGYLFVTKGMMERFPSDGDLALFVGHEIAHAEDKDALEDLGQNTFEELSISSTLLKSRVKVEGSDKTVGDLRKLLKESIYESSLSSDRENELAADRRGAELLIKAGYEPGEARKAIEAICSKPVLEIGSAISSHRDGFREVYLLRRLST